MDTKGKFYLGKISGADEPLLYEPDDLTTHAVVVGMTGSGKTGLCIDLLEEAALNNLPALMVDPKGDITNTLLHFPNLLPEDFKPWINPDNARREGKTVDQMSVETAQNWRSGLEKSGITPDRIQALKNSAQFAIYTPGSDAGIPISILSSLKAPQIPWQENRELLRERISGTVTALLGLVGMSDIDPVRSREHILLSNVFEHAWSQGHDLDLSELILQTQSPPFQKLGVFEINTFFPERDRLELAMMLNNILASPGFQSWIEGQPLDIPSLLYTAEGKPRHSVFYIAHLSEAERMFFVTLLFSSVETWMRSQMGTTSLRALVYFDEIFGYMPPVSNPPSKTLILRMLKQARAFGVGLVLVTQNPVDLDYKALSNAGTWFIGKLQTERDKTRLLDGLESALSEIGRDRGEYERLISSLGKRVFLQHNVHDKQPSLFSTRWAMNYLAGPLARAQIRPLNQLAGAALQGSTFAQPAAPVQSAAPVQAAPISPNAAAQPAFSPAPAPTPVTPAAREANLPGSLTRPTVPAGSAEYFLPHNQTHTQAFRAEGKAYPTDAFVVGMLYKPVILGQLSVRFLNRKYNLDYDLRRTVLVKSPDRRGVVRWDDFTASAVDARALDREPVPQAHFVQLEAPFSDARAMSAMEKDFIDWGFRNSNAVVRANETLKIYAGPDVSPADFRKQCADAARQGRDQELAKLTTDFERKIDALNLKLSREQRRLDENETELQQRKMEEMGTHAENVLSLLGKRRRTLSTSLTKRRMTEQAKSDVQESQAVIKDLEKQIRALEAERTKMETEASERWSQVANEVTELTIAPFKKDVLVDIFGVAWMPYHLVKVGTEIQELPAFALPE
jgi:hypothetical protein